MEKTRYEALKHLIKSGDLIEWQSKGFVASGIRYFTGQQVNHSSLVLRIDWEELADRRFILEALGDGLKLSLLSERIADYDGKAWWYGLKSEHNEKRHAMVSWALVKHAEHTQYDFGSILKQMFGRVSVDMLKLFCSEYYQAALIAAGIIKNIGYALQPGEFESLGVHNPGIRLK